MRILFLACLVASGCATSPMVKSYPAFSSQQRAEGLELIGQYGLPVSRIKVTVREAEPGAGSPATSLGGNMAALCGEARKSYNDDYVALALASKTFADFSRDEVSPALVSTRLIGTTTDPAKQKLPKAQADPLLKKIEALAKEFAAADARIVHAMSLATLISKNCPMALKIDLAESVEVSKTQIYKLYATPSWLSDNKLTVDMESGYIKLLDATADDKTVDIVKSAVGSLGTLMSLKPWSVSQEVSAIRVDVVAVLAEMRKDGVTSRNLDKLKAVLDSFSETVSTSLAPLPGLRNPVANTYSLGALENGVNVHWTDTGVYLRDAGEGEFTDGQTITLRADCGQFGTAYASVETPAQTQPNEPDSSDTSADGILISGLRSCTVSARDTADIEMSAISFVAADDRYADTLPVSRRGLVRNTTKYTFAGGRLTKAETDRPSTAVKIAALPADLIGGLLGGFTSGFTSLKARSDAEKNYADAERTRIEAQIKLEELRDKIKKDEEAASGNADGEAEQTP